MQIRLGFLLVVKLVRLTGTRFGGAVAKMYHGVLGLACRILNDDYVTGYTVDDDFYSGLCYACSPCAADAYFVNGNCVRLSLMSLRPVDSGEVPH